MSKNTRRFTSLKLRKLEIASKSHLTARNPGNGLINHFAHLSSAFPCLHCSDPAVSAFFLCMGMFLRSTAECSCTIIVSHVVSLVLLICRLFP